jgi:hypothetical protein
MMLGILKAFTPVFCLAANVFLQVFSFRRFSGMSLLKSVYLGFACGLTMLFYIALCAFFRFSMNAQAYGGFFLSILLAYVCLSYCYFHFINLGETARRIRILRELYDSKDGLSYEELLQRYNAKMILEVRVNRLMESGQIELKKDRYFVRSPLVFLFSRMVLGMKKLLYGCDYKKFI